MTHSGNGIGREFYGSELERELGDFKSLDFEEVSMRLFPLRASQYRLQKFCDDYLNIAPDFAEFRPSAPYVFLMVVHYPKMSPGLNNLGWVAQNEVLFSVPLEGRWRQVDENGEVNEVEDLATVSPFIFVDSDMSITTGREIFGWPKYLGSYAAEINPWLSDPRRPRRLMTLKTMSFGKLYAGKELEERVFLEIEQESPQLLSFPPRIDYLMAPFVQIPKAFFDGVMAGPDLMQNIARLWGADDRSPLVEMISRWAQNLASIPPDLSANTINLKQFRASQPQAAAYQALLNGKMHFRKFHGGGMMGSVDLLRGDPTAGFTIYLHDDPAFPVIDSLGLEVERQFTFQGTSVAALKPLLPFWVSVDVSYDLSKRICWRAEGHPDHHEGRWTVQRPATAQPQAPVEPKPSEDPGFRQPPSPEKSPPTFNTALGPVVPAVEGPFDFLQTRVRVFPLRADPKVARRMILPGLADELARQLGVEIEPNDEGVFDEWVFLVVTAFGEMAAATDAIGWWGRNEVAFGRINKVRIKRPRGKDWTDHYFMQWPFVFSDSPIAVTEGREVLGLPTAYVEFSRGEPAWIAHREARQSECLLGVRLRDYPALHVGQEKRERTLIEITSMPGTGGEGNEDGKFASQLEKLKEKYKHGLQFSNLSLKQFRDSEEPTKICYRSLVAVEKGIGRWLGEPGGTGGKPLDFGLEPLAGTYQVRIHKTASWSIKKDLGLHEDETVVSSGGSRVDVFNVVHPFWLQVDQRSHVGVNLISQSIDGAWRLGPEAKRYFDFLSNMIEPAGGE